MQKDKSNAKGTKMSKLFNILLFLAFIVAIPPSSALIPFIIPDEGEEGETGSIELSGSPNAVVFIDDIPYGAIPPSGTLFIPDIRAGLRTVKVSMDGFDPEYQDIAVFINETSQVATGPFIMYGGIEITSIPEGAEVYLNGVRAGNTPVKKTMMDVGNYAISLKMIDYYPWEKMVSVNWNDNSVIEAKMIPMNIPPVQKNQTPGFTFIICILSILYICGSYTLNKKK